METGLKNYIKNMFAMDSAPGWDSSYEGVIFYDKTAKKWVVGNNEGWQVLDRKTTVTSGIATTDWIDPFEYYTNTSLSDTYTTVGSGISISTDNNSSTYGNYSMRVDTTNASGVTAISREFKPPLTVASDYVSFDLKSDTVTSGVVVQIANTTTLFFEQITAKSVIMDAADNYGNTTSLGIRSMDFYFGGELITNIHSTDFVAYSTDMLSTNYYPQYAFDTSISKTGGFFGNHWLSNGNNNKRLICVFNDTTVFDEVRINNVHSGGSSTNYGAKNIKITVSTDEITDTTYNGTISNSTLIFDDQIAEHVAEDVVDDQILELINSKITTSAFEHSINITSIDSYAKHSLFASSPDTEGVIDYLKFTFNDPGPIYNIDNMRFDSDQETYWLDVCEYTTNSGVQGVYVTTSSGLLATTTTGMVSYGNSAIKLSADTTTSGASICRTFASYIAGGHTAKSVILDIADNWGDPSYTGIRQIDFYSEGTKLALTTSDYTAYSTSYSFVPANVFDTSTSLIGGASTESWQSDGAAISQRVICVFDSEQTFDSIVVNNYHTTGGGTARGAKNVKIYTSSDSITNTVYGADISNSTTIYEGQFNMHVASDVADNQTLDIAEIKKEVINGTGRTPSTNTLLFDISSDRLGSNLECAITYEEKATKVYSVFDDSRIASLYTLSNAYKTITMDTSDSTSSAMINKKITSGKVYIEFYIENCNDQWMCFGFDGEGTLDGTTQRLGTEPGHDNSNYCFYHYLSTDWRVYDDGSYSNITCSKPNIGSTVMLALDKDNGNCWIGVDGVWNGDPATGTNPAISDKTDVKTDSYLNFGTALRYADDSVTIRANLTDCVYSAPTGFLYLDDISGTDETEELNTIVPINVVALNKFRTYSVDVSTAEYINKLEFIVTNSDYSTNYYLDSFRFY